MCGTGLILQTAGWIGTARGTGSSPTGSANAHLAPQLCHTPMEEPSEPVKAATVPGVHQCRSLLCCHWRSQQRLGSLLKKVSNYVEQSPYRLHHMCAGCDLSGGFCSTPFGKLATNITGNQRPAPGSTC